MPADEFEVSFSVSESISVMQFSTAISFSTLSVETLFSSELSIDSISVA